MAGGWWRSTQIGRTQTCTVTIAATGSSQLTLSQNNETGGFGPLFLTFVLIVINVMKKYFMVVAAVADALQ